jgi:hypothetical protein
MQAIASRQQEGNNKMTESGKVEAFIDCPWAGAKGISA